MIPIRSRQPSLNVCSCKYDSSCRYDPKIPFPRYQKPASHNASPHNSNTQATLRRPFCTPPMFSPAPDITECISRAGVATMRRNSSEGRVIVSANVRVARFTVFDISQSMSSARTAERAKLVAKTLFARERAVGFSFLKNEGLSRVAWPGKFAPS